jgi:glycosyltransferase involved in cell wall biosynthesis
MDTGLGFLDLGTCPSHSWSPERTAALDRDDRPAAGPWARVPDQEVLRHVAWEIGEKRPADAFTPTVNHVGVAMVTPTQGFAHWRILPGWVDQTAWHKGNAWRDCRLILRLYDVSYILFNGFNANRMQDEPLPGLCGQRFFKLPRCGTSQLGEVGFLLRSGEFVPAARSPVTHFARETASAHHSHAALFVADRGHVEEVGNLWDQGRILEERRKPRLRKPLRLALFTLAGPDGLPPTFVTELAAGQSSQGHEVHVFAPAPAAQGGERRAGGVSYHPLAVRPGGGPLDTAADFARATEKRLAESDPFDLFHVHEWMAGLGSWTGTRPTVLSLSSIEATRRNGAEPDELSLEIERTEHKLALSVDHVLTPPWLRDRAVAAWGLEHSRVHAFALEGRLANEWECPLDYGKVKMEVGVGPLDRLLLFIGPLEHGAGMDLLVEALPTLLHRASNLRLAFIGMGNMHGHLQHRAYQLGVGHAVRLLGHVEGSQVTRLLRAAEALVLPSRYRIPFDDAVVDLARRAGRPVITTHGGPAHLVRHEENGIITYDNPGSMVWAVDRILGDPHHAEQMGRNGRRGSDGSAPRWSDVAQHYLELCAALFPELTVAWG